MILVDYTPLTDRELTAQTGGCQTACLYAEVRVKRQREQRERNPRCRKVCGCDCHIQHDLPARGRLSEKGSGARDGCCVIVGRRCCCLDTESSISL